MRSRYIVALFLVSSTLTTTAAPPQKERCGTRLPSLEEVQQMDQQVSRARTKAKAEAADTIPVWFHVISKVPASPTVSFGRDDSCPDSGPERLVRWQHGRRRERIRISAHGGDANEESSLVRVDRNGPRVRAPGEAVSHRGGPETLNIYSVDGGPYLGFAYFPSTSPLRTWPISTA